jgi:DNA polymerase
MNIRQILSWFLESGVSETIGESPVNRYCQPLPSSTKGTITNHPTKTQPLSAKADDILLTQACRLAESASTLTELYEARQNFDGCPLHKTAAHTINGRGASSPNVLCLIESPDTNDDRIGQLMTGSAGELLDKMLNAINLNLQTNTYLSSLIPWRAPGNRKPTETESALCRPFWEKEIQLLKPQLIILFGIGPAKELLKIDSLPRARTTVHYYNNIPTFVTIPPSTLLTVPTQKKQAWEDLQKVKATLDTLHNH